MKYIDMLLSIKILDAVLCLLLTFEKVNKRQRTASRKDLL